MNDSATNVFIPITYLNIIVLSHSIEPESLLPTFSIKKMK